VADGASVWTGSCPCQPFSSMGSGRGVEDERHLWPIWRDLIAECRPSVVFGEQVASAAGRDWLAALRADLENLGYRVGAADLCAASVGSPHIRQRIFFGAVGDSDGARKRTIGRVPKGPRAECAGSPWTRADWLPCRDGKSRPVEPGSFPLAHGIPGRVGRLRGYGNAIVPQVAAAFVSAFLAEAADA
jgi:DNA (cytosine-5)-methyltransferase 1